MSKIALTPNASGTGTLTIAAPNTSTDRTLTLPDETGTVLSSGGAIDVDASAPADSLAIDASGNITVKDKIQFGIDPQTHIQAAGTSDVDLIVAADTNLRFETSTNERMRINSSGYTLINTTNNFDSAIFGVNGGNNAYVPIGCRVDQTTSASQISFRNGNGVVGSISTNGSSTAYNTSSDYRLKENVVEVTDGISRVKLLKPSKFNFIVEPDKTVDGFLAHEVQDVVPEAIHGTKDQIDKEGNPVYQGIDQSKLVPLLTAAVKELITEVEQLKTKVAILESA